MNIFKLGGWFFLILGAFFVLTNVADVLEYLTSSEVEWSNYSTSITSFLIGAVQSLVGYFFIKISSYTNKSLKPEDYHKLKVKLEGKIHQLESKGVNAERYRTMLKTLQEKQVQAQYDRFKQ